MTNGKRKRVLRTVTLMVFAGTMAVGCASHSETEFGSQSCSADAECDSDHFCQSGTCHLDAVAISVGWASSAAVLADGSVYAWGYNAQGKIGPEGPALGAPGSGEPIQNAPVKVTGLGAPAKTVEAGSTHVCALLENDEVWCWGSNVSGQLGNGVVTTNYNPTPSKVIGLPDGVTAISTRENTTCALVGESGEMYCWGDNVWGELGTGAAEQSSPTPVKVENLAKASQISMSDHGCAIVGATQYCWGSNNYGQCGQSEGTDTQPSPVEVGFGACGAPQQLSATSSHSCALLAGGDVYCWGWNVDGCLGDPSTEIGATVTQPVRVGGISDVTQIATSRYTDCALLKSGRVSCWGSQNFGALVDGMMDPNGFSVTPVEVGGVSDAVAISVSEHACAVEGNGSIKCWGKGTVGQLGNSASEHSAVPVDVTVTW